MSDIDNGIIPVLYFVFSNYFIFQIISLILTA